MERHAAFDPLAEVQLKGETGLTDAESGQGLVRHGSGLTLGTTPRV